MRRPAAAKSSDVGVNCWLAGIESAGFGVDILTMHGASESDLPWGFGVDIVELIHGLMMYRKGYTNPQQVQDYYILG
jgi:hypothetical protein